MPRPLSRLALLLVVALSALGCVAVADVAGTARGHPHHLDAGAASHYGDSEPEGTRVAPAERRDPPSSQRSVRDVLPLLGIVAAIVLAAPRRRWTAGRASALPSLASSWPACSGRAPPSGQLLTI